MQKINVRDLLNLRRDKVILSFFIVFGLWLSGNELFAQRSHRWSGHVDMNLVNYDKRKIHYGFLIGVQASRFKVNLGEGYDAPAFSDVLNIEATQNYGFSTGFIFNLKVADFFDFRLTPKVDFNEYGLQYTFRNGVKYKDLGFKAEDDLVETVMISLPVLVRYVSQRRGNYRMYMIAGVAPSVEVSGKKKKDIILEANKYDATIEYGFGAEFYLPFSKFAPEIRFSHGLLNLLGENDDRPIAGAIDRLTAHKVSLYFQFH